MPQFAGIKVCQDANTCARFRDLHTVEVPDGYSTEILTDKPGVLGGGGPNSGFQAINLAVQFGATRIMLVGFDMHTVGGVHWHGAHGDGLVNPHEVCFVKWRRILDAAAARFRSLGVELVNCSPHSALSAYPKMTIEQAMTRWSL